MCEKKPVVIKKSLLLADILKYWLKQIDKMDYLTKIELDGDYAFAFDTAYLLFPLMESISFNLYGKSIRYYMKILGLTSKESEILVTVFRNGLIHNSQFYEIQYDDGTVHWAILASGGTGGIRPYDVGYEDTEDSHYSIPPERVFDYETVNSVSYASLYLDRLIALVRHDLINRMQNIKEQRINFIIGQKVIGNKPQHNKT